MALTFLVIIKTLGFLIVLALMFAVPVMVKKKMTTYFNQKMRKVENTGTGDRVLRQYFMATAVSWVCLVIIYIPCTIPTLLLLL